MYDSKFFYGYSEIIIFVIVSKFEQIYLMGDLLCAENLKIMSWNDSECHNGCKQCY